MPRLYNRSQREKVMAKVTILLLLIVVSALLAAGQSRSPSDKLPTITTQGKTNPETVSDINSQLIWLLAAAPIPSWRKRHEPSTGARPLAT